ncbi:head completion/stabilization protein [Erwinia typographi]|uniref:Head completion/stabilization protein n=1 Tax=Erwinia typographi TaxID=371042 RepID=A0A0A3Z840_9GAMM|nr:head completion/stabilization protein [Erwinia typographi]KGT95262.1 head completion/stabilization protein [Erwinia typographi]
MKFVTPEQAPDMPEIIPNNSFWPDIDLAGFRAAMRVDGTVTPARLRQVTLTAMSEVNAELYAWRERQEINGFNSLADVPAEQLAGRSVRLHHYENAVWCWARAVLNERYQDFDATAAAAKRGEELENATGDLWRDARWAISRVQNVPHCTVELI